MVKKYANIISIWVPELNLKNWSFKRETISSEKPLLRSRDDEASCVELPPCETLLLLTLALSQRYLFQDDVPQW
jgi:hypothetical protein